MLGYRGWSIFCSGIMLLICRPNCHTPCIERNCHDVCWVCSFCFSLSLVTSCTSCLSAQCTGRCAGLSNLICGLCGAGMTGSYIFRCAPFSVSPACDNRLCLVRPAAVSERGARRCRSQTIFSRRAGVSHRIHGVIIAAVELALAVIPYSLVQYLVRLQPSPA